MDIESSILFARLSIEELGERRAFVTDASELLAIREQETYLQILIAELELEQARPILNSTTGSNPIQVVAAPAPRPWDMPPAPASPILREASTSDNRPSSPIFADIVYPPSLQSLSGPNSPVIGSSLTPPSPEVRPEDDDDNLIDMRSHTPPAEDHPLQPFGYIFRLLDPEPRIPTPPSLSRPIRIVPPHRSSTSPLPRPPSPPTAFPSASSHPTLPIASTSPPPPQSLPGPSRRPDNSQHFTVRVLNALHLPLQTVSAPTVGPSTILSPNDPFRDPDEDSDLEGTYELPPLSPSVSSTSSRSLNEQSIPQHVFQRAPQVCIACTERKTPALEAPCHHYFCDSCLHEQIRNIVYKDQFSYPFRCCKDQPMSAEMIAPHLPPNLRSAFEAKSKELSVPLLERAYCRNPKCATFLGRTETIGRYTICPTCFTLSCVGKPTVTSPHELAHLARINKWQTCYQCQTTIEQKPGCDHIQCVCGAEFCYACGSKWKTCTCPYWNEGRLIVDTAEL